MSALISDRFSALVLVMVFVAAVLLFEGLYLLWDSSRGPQARKIGQRLRALSAGGTHSRQAAVLKNRMLSEVPVLEKALLSMPRAHRLDRLILQSGLDWTVSRLLLSSLTLCIGTYAACRLYGQLISPALELVLAAAAGLLPWAWLMWQRGRRLRNMERQLPDALDLICRALRAGHSFPSGLKMVGEEMTDPIAREFGMAHDEINFGIALQEALSNLAARIPMTDLRFFVIAVLVQRETGGNLAEVLTNLSRLIRNRLKLQAKIKVLTAEGRISAWALGLLPFVLALLLNLSSPDFINVLWKDPAGMMVTQVTLTLMAFGALWLWRITKVRV